MRILVLCDDIWHPAEVLQKGLAFLESFGFAFDWVTDARAWAAERMAAYPVTILSKANNISAADESPWMTGEVEGIFLEYIRKGKGLLALHSGTAGYENAHMLRGLMGGVFREHPEQRPVRIEPLGGHLLSRGCEAFTVRDEHYFMEMVDDQVDVFLTTTSDHGTQPGGWTRIEGDGRVCVLTPGHNLEIWLHPIFQTILLNALRWCCKHTVN